jgi:colanic acid/amylovoran biosynthesis protein
MEINRLTILIDVSSQHHRNVGDVAMLQVALQRFRCLWPERPLLVLSDAPERLATLCPQATYVPTAGRFLWGYALSGRLVRHLPAALVGPWDVADRLVRYQMPGVRNFVQNLKVATKPALRQDLGAFRLAMAQADCLVATGGGYLTDEFPDFAMAVLSTLEWAIQLKKPTLMVGQGIGPLQNSRLRRKASTILPRVDLIMVREKRTSLPLLRSLGVSAERILATGDDAIALAYTAHPPTLGQGIGINLRQAPYAGLTAHHIMAVGQAVGQVAAQVQAPLLAVPTSAVDADQAIIEQVWATAAPRLGMQTRMVYPLDTPLAVIQQVGRCRVMLTGSYHAGVFALAQGIPVVGLAKSQYYQDKFHGLAEQFGIGCTVLALDDSNLEEKVTDALLHAWYTAEQTQAPLLAAARQQMAAGEQAYQQARGLVDSRREARTASIF